MGIVKKETSPNYGKEYQIKQKCVVCSRTRGKPSGTPPDWFVDCDKAKGGCFKLKVPKEQAFNIGNTTFGASKAGGTQWCIDHLQGFIYNKVVDPIGAMYYEVDDISHKPPAPQCRFLVGAEQDGKGGVTYHARTYNDADERRNKSQPAPGQYQSQPAIGKQVESKYREGQQFSLHGGCRDFIKPGAQGEPGPGAYIDPLKEGRNARGEAKSVLSRQKSFSSAVFGTADARPTSAAGGSKLEKRPGPNEYVIPSALGTQPWSRYKTQPIFSFGAR